MNTPYFVYDTTFELFPIFFVLSGALLENTAWSPAVLPAAAASQVQGLQVGTCRPEFSSTRWLCLYRLL